MIKQSKLRALGTRGARLLLTALGLLAMATPSSCGSNASSSRPDGSAGGAGGHGGVDGGTSDAAGGGSAGGMMGAVDSGIPDADGGVDGGSGGTGTGGTGGADAAVDSGADAIVDSGVDVMPETCGPGGQGCARLSVPLVDPQTGTFFAIPIPPTDLSGVSAVFRFCLVPSAPQGAGWVQPFAQEGISPYAGQYDVVAFGGIPACPSFIEYTYNFPDAPDPSSTDPSPWFTRVQNLGLKIQSTDGASGSWANPTVVYVDSVTLFRRPPAGDAGASSDGGAPADADMSNDGGAPSDADQSNDGSVSDDGGNPDGGAPSDTDADASDGAAAPPPPPLPGPFTFDSSSFPFTISSYNEVLGSALDWVP